jgi:hypothetical protein
MHQSNINKADYYFLDDEYINIIDQLNETVAYSSLVEPIPHTITLWADPGTGIYPLTDERGGTETTTIVVNPETGEMSNVDNIRFTDQVGALGLHVEGVDLYYGTFNITDESFGVNIYNSDGNLLGDRIVDLDGSSLTFTSDNPSVLSALGDWDLSGVLYTDSEGGKTRTDSISGKTTSTINVSGCDFNNGIKVYDSGTLPVALDDVFWRNTSNNHLMHNNVDLENLGDVVGPASATNNAFALFNTTTGKLIKNSTVTHDGTTMTIPGALTLTTIGTATSANVLFYNTTTKAVTYGTTPTGDVVGPVLSSDNGIALFNGTTGKLLKNATTLQLLRTGTNNLVINTAGATPSLSGVTETTILGLGAGAVLTTGTGGILIGFGAGNALNSAGYATAIGQNALQLATSASNCVAIGAVALSSATSVNGCTAIGVGALGSLLTGIWNTALGRNAGSSYNSGETNNISIGYNCFGTAGDQNTIRIGTSNTSCYLAGISGVTPSGTPQYVTIGTGGQLGSVSIPTDHVVGPASAISDSIVTFNGTTGKLIKDSGAAILVPSFSNLFISSSGNTPVITSATNCTTLGTGAGVALTSGTNNTFVGYTAGGSISTSTENTAFGSLALVGLTTGSGSNTAVGKSALSGLTTGANNTAVGHLAGLNYTGAETNNILIGKGVFGTVGESSTIRIGGTQTSCYLQGISGTPPGTAQVVTVGTGGRLGSATVSQVLNSASITTITTTPYTALNTTQLLRVDCSSGAHVVNLPTALTIMKITIVDTGSGSGVNTLTISPNGSDTIFGNASIVNILPYYSITLQSDGIATWYSA